MRSFQPRNKHSFLLILLISPKPISLYQRLVQQAAVLSYFAFPGAGLPAASVTHLQGRKIIGICWDAVGGCVAQLAAQLEEGSSDRRRVVVRLVKL
jgi:hypothetical protein